MTGLLHKKYYFKSAILLIFFLSGLTALAYQVLWSRYLWRFIGVSAFSYAIVLSSFMAGLAIGSSFFGRLADRFPRPFLLYAGLEILIGFYSLVIFLPLFNLLQGWSTNWFMDHQSGFVPLAVKILFSAILILPPTILMGGTLPAVVKHLYLTTCDLPFTDRLRQGIIDISATVRSHIGRTVSLCYAVNAFGAVVGTLIMAFYLLPCFGLQNSLFIVGLSNILLGILALLLALDWEYAFLAIKTVSLPCTATSSPCDTTPSPCTATSSPCDVVSSPALEHEIKLTAGQELLLLLVIFMTGYLSFSYEIVWNRFFSIVLGSSTYSFSIILAAFIFGIGLGSFSLSLFNYNYKLKSPFTLFAWTQLLIAFFVSLTLPYYPELFWFFRWLSSLFANTTSAFYLCEFMRLFVCFLLLLPMSILIGMSLPLCIQSLSHSVANLGLVTGRVYAVNTWGNVIGAAFTGLYLLPSLGMEVLLRLSGSLNGLLSLIVFVHFSSGRRSHKYGIAIIVLLLTLANLFFSDTYLSWEKRWFSLRNYRRSELADCSRSAAWQMVKDTQVELFLDDPAAHLMVITRQSNSFKKHYLLVNGKTEASTNQDMSTQLLLSHLPLLLHHRPQQILMIGLASGVSVGAALTHPIESIDVIELLQTMPLATQFFQEENNQPFSDPRFHFINDDGRAWLRSTTKHYDVIISEPSNPWMAGVSSLFTVEFNREVAEKLSADGIFLQWLQAYEISDQTLTVIIAGFRDVFPFVYAFQVGADILLMGTKKPLQPDYPELQKRWHLPAVSQQLRFLGLENLYSLLSLQIWSPSSVNIIASLAVERNTDDNLFLEYQAPIDLFTFSTPAIMPEFDERIYPTEHIFAYDYLKNQSSNLASLFSNPRFANQNTKHFILAHCFRYFHENNTYPATLPTQFTLEHLPPPTMIAQLAAELYQKNDQQFNVYLANYRTAILLAALSSSVTEKFWFPRVENWYLELSSEQDRELRFFLSEFYLSFLELKGLKKEAVRILFAELENAQRPMTMHTLWRICRLDHTNACTIAINLFQSCEQENLFLKNYISYRGNTKR